MSTCPTWKTFALNLNCAGSARDVMAWCSPFAARAATRAVGGNRGLQVQGQLTRGDIDAAAVRLTALAAVAPVVILQRGRLSTLFSIPALTTIVTRSSSS